MRLTSEQKSAIETVFKQVFTQGKILLFGSRVNDKMQGGDIDLFVDTEQNVDNLFNLKISFLVALKRRIGDQKIDLVFSVFAPLDLKKEVEKKGIVLCQI